MAQPFEFKKDRILDEARGLFARFGYRKCTVGDIAEACGLTKSALYHYFSSKGEIFTEVTRREGHRLLSAIDEAVEAERDPLLKLRAFSVTRFQRARELLELYRLSQERFVELYPMLERAYEEFFTRERELLESILDGGVRSGTFRPIPVSLLAETAMAAFRGLETYLFREGAEEIPLGVTQLLDVLAHGLLAPGNGAGAEQG